MREGNWNPARVEGRKRRWGRSVWVREYLVFSFGIMDRSSVMHWVMGREVAIGLKVITEEMREENSVGNVS